MGIVFSFDPGAIDSALIGFCLAGAGIATELAVFCVLYVKAPPSYPVKAASSLKEEKLHLKKEAPWVFEIEKERLLKRQNDFIEQTLLRMANRSAPSFILPSNTDDPEFVGIVQRAYLSDEERVTRFEGNMHCCMTTSEIPGVLFKSSRGSRYHKNAESYVARADRCRTLCDENFLYVPWSKPFSIDGQGQVVMEERCDLAASDPVTSRALYQWILQDPALHRYARALLTYLALFICKSSFADVKYDNIILKKDGRICLFDLSDPPADDRSPKIVGLTAGRGGNDGGLFGILPSAWIDDFVLLVNPYLTADEVASLAEKLPDIKQRALEREEEMRLVKLFYEKRDIRLPTQPLVWQEEDFSSYTAEERLRCKSIVELLNDCIKKYQAISLVGGRHLSLDGYSVPSLRENFPTGFTSPDERYLKILKEKNYIFSYRVKSSMQTLVIC